ncbi:O-antigen ligase family protein [Candidatus Paracaedibacter symbiosus]|uniref:O-antigen ligase family protein n=1 Tax=Candidatus Paracaedibacter symbiosus TaxID=244582 RepID=UPI000509D439|nr:O-antigen ligase family protein [Candidatus Paracaedibacter symbiosus]
MIRSILHRRLNTKSLNSWDILPILCGLTLPLYTALSSIFFVLTFLSSFFKPGLLHNWKQSARLPAIKFLLLFLGWLIIRFSYANLGSMGNILLMKHTLKPLLIPFFMHVFTKANERWIVNAFILSMLLTVILALIQCFPGVNFKYAAKFTSGSIFKNHIATSIFMAFACFIVAHQALSHKRQERFIYCALFVFFAFHLFYLNHGRTGYIIFAALFVLFLFQRCTIKVIGISLISGLIIALSVFKLSPNFNKRINEAQQEYHLYHQQGKSETSTGLRLELWRNSIKLFKQKPILGWGTNSFRKAYQTLPETHKTTHAHNPHNQFLLIAVENGIVGLLLFLGFLLCCGWASLLMPANISHLFQGVLVTFIVGSFGNSLLGDHSEGLFFVLFCALGLSTLIRPKIITYKVTSSS